MYVTSSDNDGRAEWYCQADDEAKRSDIREMRVNVSWKSALSVPSRIRASNKYLRRQALYLITEYFA